MTVAERECVTASAKWLFGARERAEIIEKDETCLV
jgi:hypothetical protein